MERVGTGLTQHGAPPMVPSIGDGDDYGGGDGDDYGGGGAEFEDMP